MQNAEPLRLRIASTTPATIAAAERITMIRRNMPMPLKLELREDLSDSHEFFSVKIFT